MFIYTFNLDAKLLCLATLGGSGALYFLEDVNGGRLIVADFPAEISGDVLVAF